MRVINKLPFMMHLKEYQHIREFLLFIYKRNLKNSLISLTAFGGETECYVFMASHLGFMGENP
jgi:hypothetical protein